MDIKEIAKKMTKKEFVNLSGSQRISLFKNKICPHDHGLYDRCKSNESCKGCWENAVKDIKFKDDIEKPLVKVGVVEFYENGIVKFPKSNNKIWMQQATEHVGPVIREQLQETISNYMEGEKMEDKKIKVKYNSEFDDLNLTKGKEYLATECGNGNCLIKDDTGNIAAFPVCILEKVEDKTIKVRCISNGKGTFCLTKDKEYEAREYDKDRYIVKNNAGVHSYYLKELFEKIKDTLMVECIDNENQEKFLTLNEKYKVLEESDRGYFIIDDTGHKYLAHKSRFKPVEPQRENKTYIVDDDGKELRIDKDKIIKEYSVMELLGFPVGTQFKDKDGCLVEIQKIEDTENEKKIVFSGSFEEGGLEISTIWERMKFTKVEELQKEVKEESECYTKDYGNNDKNGKCTAPTEALKYFPCNDRNTNWLIQIDYEKEYKKICRSNERLRIENKGLKDILNKKQNQWENEQVERIEELEKELEQAKKLANDKFDEVRKLKEEAIKDHDRIKDRDIEIKQLKFDLEQTNKYLERESLENAIEITKNKGIEWMNKYNEIKEKLDKADSKVKRLGGSTNEYYYNWIECKEENKMLKDHIKELQRQHENQEEIKTIKEKPSVMNNYEAEINELRCRFEEAQKVANSFEIMADKYREKQKSMESDLIKYESTIKSLKETIKGLASML